MVIGTITQREQDILREALSLRQVESYLQALTATLEEFISRDAPTRQILDRLRTEADVALSSLSDLEGESDHE